MELLAEDEPLGQPEKGGRQASAGARSHVSHTPSVMDILSPDEAGKNIDPLHSAAAMGDKKLVIEILRENKGSNIVNARDKYDRTPLVYAVVSDKFDVVQHLMASGADIFAVDREGRNALHWAVYHGRHKMLKLLMQNEADPTVMDYDGRGVMHLCSHGKTTKCFDLLIKNPVLAEMATVADNRGMNPLHWAAFNASVEHTKVFLGLGCDIYETDSEGKTALHWAATTTSTEVIEVLIKAYSNDPARRAAAQEDPMAHAINFVDAEGRTPLHVAVGTGNVTLAALLVQQEYTVIDVQDESGRTPLHWAVQLGHADMTKKLLELGGFEQFRKGDINGWTALHYAAHEGLLECAIEIMKIDGIKDVGDDHKQTALMLAVIGNHVELATFLLDTGSDPNGADDTGSTPMHSAAFAGSATLLRELKERGGAVDPVDYAGHTPLMFACEQGNFEATVELVKLEADINATDQDERGMVHFAATGGNLDLIEHICRTAGASVDARDAAGRTALHTAVFSGQLQVVELLIGLGCNVNSQDNEGISALHWAASAGNVDCISLLLQADAFPNHTEYHEQRLTPLDYALQSNQGDAVEFLRASGALVVDEVRDLAAQHIQSWWNGYRARIQLLAVWQAHLAQLQGREIKGPRAAALGPDGKKREEMPKGKKGMTPRTRRKSMQDAAAVKSDRLGEKQAEHKRRMSRKESMKVKDPGTKSKTAAADGSGGDAEGGTAERKTKPAVPRLGRKSTKRTKAEKAETTKPLPAIADKPDPPAGGGKVRGGPTVVKRKPPVIRNLKYDPEPLLPRTKRTTLKNRVSLAPPRLRNVVAASTGKKPPHHIDGPSLRFYSRSLLKSRERRRKQSAVEGDIDGVSAPASADGEEDIVSPRGPVVKRERHRVNAVRAYTQAAIVIQQCYRAWVKRGRPRPKSSALKTRSKIDTGRVRRPGGGVRRPPGGGGDAGAGRTGALARADDVLNRARRSDMVKVDVRDRRQQIAALTIQLAWRQYLSRVAMRPPSAPRRILNLQPWSPEVRAQARRMREFQIYTQREKVLAYRPERSRMRSIRKAGVKIPKIAITSFNVAYETYYPEEVRERYEAQRGQFNALAEKAETALLRTRKRRIDRLRDEARGHRFSLQAQPRTLRQPGA